MDDEIAETPPVSTLVMSLAHNPTAIPTTFADENQCGGLPIIPYLTAAELMEKQRADASIREQRVKRTQQKRPGGQEPDNIREKTAQILLMGVNLNQTLKITIMTVIETYELRPWVLTKSQNPQNKFQTGLYLKMLQRKLMTLTHLILMKSVYLTKMRVACLILEEASYLILERVTDLNRRKATHLYPRRASYPRDRILKTLPKRT
ncbi:unnamed protein product [Pleuronectes platessa]|uniref:Uncharacterized protein n=1 Tax=Pleuronectes platessa TaxID=8262 RepID=A0A9N7U2P0_PLEPL|nr:unnamed protein product [Pleuronectes platessa]